MKYCPNCGASCADEAVFCGECGAPFAAAGQPVNQEPFAGTAEQPVNEQPQAGQDQAYQGYEQNQNYNQGYTYQGPGQTSPNYNQQGYGQNGGYQNYGPDGQPPMTITGRGIAVAVILTIVTCGIYGIFWMIKLNDEINYLSGETNATSGGMVFLFSLITCGIYAIYWAYKMGERVDRIKGDPHGNSAILFLIVSIIGFSIVAYALMQDTVNKAVGYQN